MKIAVLGRHPIPQPGFMGVMSLYECKWFSAFGHDVTMLIPFKNPGDLQVFLKNNKIKDLNELFKYESEFEIKPIYFENKNQFKEFYDVLVWQSYNKDDWDNLFKFARTRCKIITKNFPKFLPTEEYVKTTAIGHFLAFDLVGCALKDDFEMLNNNPKFSKEMNDRYFYSPRGADSTYLNSNSKLDIPIIGIDAPIQGSDKAVEHIVKSVKLLQKDRKVQVRSFLRPIAGLNTTVIKVQRFDQFYNNFFNKLWVYCVIDYNHSSAHIRGYEDHPILKDRAIYEVQNVECQMAGVPLFGYKRNIWEELYIPNKTGFVFDDGCTPKEMKDILINIIDNQTQIRKDCRKFAVENHDWKMCIKMWEQALIKLIDSGYKRES